MRRLISRLRQVVVYGTCDRETPDRIPGSVWPDIFIMIAMAAIGGSASFYGAMSIDIPVDFGGSNNVWFSADINRVYACMNNPEHVYHYRASVHPLFASIGYPPTKILRDLFSVDPITAVRIIVSAVAMLSLAAMYGVLRLIGCRRLDAVLFAVLAATSAWGMFWNTVPETYPFGTLSILLALAFVAAAAYRRFSFPHYVLVSAMTLSITVTNWMFGLLIAFVKLPWRRAFSTTVYAFATVSFLFGVQKYFVPEAVYFIGDRGEKLYVLHPDSENGACRARSFLFHSMVMPDIKERDNPQSQYFHTLTVQRSDLGSGSRWGLCATLLWPVVLGAGLLGIAFVFHQRHFRVVLMLTLLLQFLLHMLYGEETFLFSGHFGPLLVVLAAFGTFTRARPVILFLTAALIVNSAVNNYIQFRWAGDEFQRHTMQRQEGDTGKAASATSCTRRSGANEYDVSVSDYGTMNLVKPRCANYANRRQQGRVGISAIGPI